MTTVINTNSSALNTYRNMSGMSNMPAKVSQRLSSGLRINSASGDAAELAISAKTRTHIKNLNNVEKNISDAKSLFSTGGRALLEINRMLTRARALAIKAANDTNTDGDRNKMDMECRQLLNAIDELVDSAEFNSDKILKSSARTAKASEPAAEVLPEKELWVQMGASAKEGKLFKWKTVSSNELLLQNTKLNSSGEAKKAIGDLDSAMTYVSDIRAQFGDYTNRLEAASKTLMQSSQSPADVESRIHNADMAKAMMKFTKTNILSSAATAMISQANQSHQRVLSLMA